jgi:hypothetical protein
MFTHPDCIGQLAREHHHDMLAQASQRRLRNQHGRRSPGTPNAAAKFTPRLVEALARAGVVAAETPGATWPARPHQLAEPAGHASTPDRRC